MKTGTAAIVTEATFCIWKLNVLLKILVMTICLSRAQEKDVILPSTDLSHVRLFVFFLCNLKRRTTVTAHSLANRDSLTVIDNFLLS